MKIGVLTSGVLGENTLKKILEKYSIEFVFTNKNSTGIISICKSNNLPYFVGNPRNGKGFNFLKQIKIDLIISINYLYLLDTDIINYPQKGIFNIHGSLLPKYRGRTPHVWAIINNEKITGITAHMVDSGCDTGDIISQKKVKIEEYDTGNDILKKFNFFYFNLIEDVLNRFKLGNLNLRKQDEKLATYFGKRSPSDGLINWNWSKERIKNWVRAQAFPYPGAFTYISNQQVIIDEVKFSSLGFNYLTENGTIINTKPNIIVKTPNGALELIKIRNHIEINIGDKFV